MKDKISVIVVFSSKIFVAILGVILLSLETKFIQPDILGEYSLLSGVVNAGVSLCVGWVGSSALRYYDSSKNKLANYNTTISFSGSVSTFTLVILVIFLGFIAPSLYIHKYLYLVVFLIILQSSFEIYEKVLRASANFKIYSVLIVLQCSLNVLFFYSIARNNQNNIEIIFLSSIISFLFFDVFAFMITQSYKGISISYLDKKLNRKFLKYGLPMIGVWAISWILNYSDRYMINIFYSTYEVGLYTIAYTISQNAIGLFTTSITLTFFPMLIKKWNSEGKASSIYYINRIIEYFLLYMIPALLGLSLISKHFYGTLIDFRYIDGSSVISITAIGFFFLGLNNILYKIWQLEERTSLILIFMCISCLINIIANAICLPVFGFIAAAYTTAFSYFFIFVVVWFMIKRNFNVKIPVIQIFKSLVASIPMCIILLAVDSGMNDIFSIIIYVLISGFSYFVVQLFLGNFREELIFIVHKAKGR